MATDIGKTIKQIKASGGGGSDAYGGAGGVGYATRAEAKASVAKAGAGSEQVVANEIRNPNPLEGTTTNEMGQIISRNGVKQPTPATVQAGAGLPGSTAPGNIALNPAQQATYDTAVNKYQQAHGQLKGQEASQDPGVGKGVVTNALNDISPPQPDRTVVDTQIQEDPFTEELAQIREDYKSAENQTKALFQEVKNYSDEIAGLDEKIIDAESIINGTEDDIRNEIQMAGGFGTDSQVQALALGRNKVLLQNYNKLVQLRDSKERHMDTMINFAQEERAYAAQRFDSMINYVQEERAFRQSAIQNTKDQYSKYTPQQLQAMFGGDPKQTMAYEKLMGIGEGGLAKLAAYVAPLSEMDKLDMDVKRANIRQSDASAAASNASAAKTRAEIGAVTQPGQPSPYTAERAFRTVQSVDELGIKAQASPGIFGKTAALPLPDFLRTDAYRNFKTELNTLKASIAFGELTAMREASKTGGALGSIAVQELQLLESALGGLNMSQSAENFQLQLQKVKTSVNRWNQQQQTQGASPQQPTITAPTGEQVIITD